MGPAIDNIESDDDGIEFLETKENPLMQ